MGTSLHDTLARLQAKGSVPRSLEGGEAIEIVDFSIHTPYEVYISSDQIAKAFYDKLFALQGRRNTYGAAFVTHSSAAIWNLTDQLVTEMWSVAYSANTLSLS